MGLLHVDPTHLPTARHGPGARTARFGGGSRGTEGPRSPAAEAVVCRTAEKLSART